MKIMLAMLRTLGDVILGTTLCRELKVDYPDAEIHFFVNRAYSQVLENNPYVNKIRASEEWVLDMLFIEFSKNKYDKVYLPYQVRQECNAWHQQERNRHQHLLDFYWKRMGRHRFIEDRECYVFPREEDSRKADQLISWDVPRVAVHSTSNVATKDWPYFDVLTEELRILGYAVLQVGAKSDKAVSGAIDFRGELSLLEIAAVLKRCSAFIGIDSGISYLADAMRVPCAIVQGSTDPVTSGPISNRVMHLFSAKTGYDDCQIVRCHANCRHENNCITAVKPSHVIEKILPILEGKSSIIPAGV